MDIGVFGLYSESFEWITCRWCGCFGVALIDLVDIGLFSAGRDIKYGCSQIFGRLFI